MRSFLDDFNISITGEAWTERELETLRSHLVLFSETFGVVMNQLGGIVIERTDTGSSLGLAYHNQIKLNARSPFTAWSVIHELAHVWDAKNNWSHSRDLEKFTGGFTSKWISALKRRIPGQCDAGASNSAGTFGRKPGCNAAGYFFRAKPSGSNWRFNRKEDFAESVAMYCGWGRDNALSKTAHGRITRYLLPNGARDPLYGITDHWSDYARYFYPPNGDYSKTKRWRFVDGLVK